MCLPNTSSGPFMKKNKINKLLIHQGQWKQLLYLILINNVINFNFIPKLFIELNVLNNDYDLYLMTLLRVI